MNKKRNIFFIGILFLLLDQITKYLIINKSFNILPNILKLSYLENTGIAFSMNLNNILTIIISILLIIFFLIILNKNYNKKSIIEKISLIFIITGATSNLLDRIFRKYVIDFIEIKLFDFPSFNLADIYIVIGVLVFIILINKMNIKM